MLNLLGFTVKVVHYFSELKRKKREDLYKKRLETEPTVVFKKAPWESDIVLVYVLPASKPI